MRWIAAQVIASDFSFKGVDERAEFCDMPIFSGDKEIYRKVGSQTSASIWPGRTVSPQLSGPYEGDLSPVTFLNDLVAGGLKDLSVMGTMHEVGYWEGAINESTCEAPKPVQHRQKRPAPKPDALAGRQPLQATLAARLLHHWRRSPRQFHLCQTGAGRTGRQKDLPVLQRQNLYDFIDVDQLANMIVAFSVLEEINGIINVCTGEPRNLAGRSSKIPAG